MGLHKKHCNCFYDKVDFPVSQAGKRKYTITRLSKCSQQTVSSQLRFIGKMSSKFECIFTLSGMKWFFPFFLDLTDVWKIPCGKLRCKKIWKTSTRLKDKKGCENPDELTRLWHQRCCFRQRRIQPCRRNPCGRQSRRWLSRGSKCQLLGRSIPSPAGKTSFEANIWSLWK